MAVASGAGCSYVHHVPPGQSAAFSLARKPELVALPPSPEPSLPPEMHAVEPELPDSDKISDSFALGNFCMVQGRYADAIAAYQNAVKLKPDFADAWNKLAIAYQDSGDEKKAMAAFKKSKTASTQ